jgi:PHD/YefM family antitoxin component YafN of YafNO toxin-antitoxin module
MKRVATVGKRTSIKALTDRKKTRHASVGELPVVILPLEDYERMREDLEMLSSQRLPREIETARQEARKGQVMTLAEVKRKLRLS